MRSSSPRSHGEHRGRPGRIPGLGVASTIRFEGPAQAGAPACCAGDTRLLTFPTSPVSVRSVYPVVIDALCALQPPSIRAVRVQPLLTVRKAGALNHDPTWTLPREPASYDPSLPKHRPRRGRIAGNRRRPRSCTTSGGGCQTQGWEGLNWTRKVRRTRKPPAEQRALVCKQVVLQSRPRYFCSFKRLLPLAMWRKSVLRRVLAQRASAVEVAASDFGFALASSSCAATCSCGWSRKYGQTS